MTNVHQLVVELANYEEQKRWLEQQLYDLESEYIEDYDNIRNLHADEYNNGDESVIAILDARKEKYLEAVETIDTQLDMVYDKIDDIQNMIDEDSERGYGFDDED